jgi:regulator of sigma D
VRHGSNQVLDRDENLAKKTRASCSQSGLKAYSHVYNRHNSNPLPEICTRLCPFFCFGHYFLQMHTIA